MDQDNCELAKQWVSARYINQGSQALAARHKRIKALLSSRRLPDKGWDEATIEMLIQDAALMDSNNFPDNVGVGEREARVVCPMVARRHYRLAHGIGRSGDISAEQPKAAGSSLLAKLTCCLAGDALRLAGMQELAPVVVLPLATGMSMTLVLLAAAAARGGGAAKYVIWSRIDQKTCLKAITAANLQPVVVELQKCGDELQTDVEGIKSAISMHGASSIAAVVTTTSCFAPRAADDVIAVAKLCAQLGVPHVINNAYGVQSAQLCAQVTAALRKGRVDAIVQSTDKNFLVPVAGAIVAAPKTRPHLAQAVAQRYPGRASMAAHLDLLTTLLYLGASRWQQLLAQRERLLPVLQQQLQQVAERCGERVLHTPGNPISVAMTVGSKQQPAVDPVGARSGQHGQQQQAGDDDQATWQQQTKAADSADTSGGSPSSSCSEAASGTRPRGKAAEAGATATNDTDPSAAAAAAEVVVPAATAAAGSKGASAAGQRASPPTDITALGAMLWSRCISGTRVVAPGKQQQVAGITFQDYGSHNSGYPHAYLTAAAAVGTTEEEVEEFAARLTKTVLEHRKHSAKH